MPTKLWGQPDIWQPLLGEAVRPSWLLQGVAGRNQVLCVEVDGTERHETWKEGTKKKQWILEGTGAGTRPETEDMYGTKGCRRRIRTLYWMDIWKRNSLMPLICQSPEFPEAFQPRLKVDGFCFPMYIDCSPHTKQAPPGSCVIVSMVYSLPGLKEILLFGKVRKIGIEQLCTHTLIPSPAVSQSLLGDYDHNLMHVQNDWFVRCLFRCLRVWSSCSLDQVGKEHLPSWKNPTKASQQCFSRHFLRHAAQFGSARCRYFHRAAVACAWAQFTKVKSKWCDTKSYSFRDMFRLD